ncbi:MAG: nitrophenyl compound nitroreductase subunit ArsF family protein, partial [Paludibacteraceae bacterium]
RIGFALSLICLLSACGGGGRSQNHEQSQTTLSDTVRAPIEILYFYGKQRCATCRAIEQVVAELTQSELREAIASGQVHYRAVDWTQETALAERYKVAWSSLIIDCHGEVTNLTEQAFAYARQQPDKLKEEVMKVCNGCNQY